MTPPPAPASCPSCGSPARPGEPYCRQCGQPLASAAPVAVPRVPWQPLDPAAVPPASAGLGQAEALALVEGYRQARSAFTWSLWAGLCCFPPLLIFTLVQHLRARDIRARIVAAGLDPEVWLVGA